MTWAKTAIGSLVCSLIVVSGCRGRPNWGAKKTLVKSRLMLIGRELTEYFEIHGQYPRTLSDLGIPASLHTDPFAGQPLLYVTASDGEGARYACLIASTGGDRRFQLTPTDYSGKNVGRFPKNWLPAIPAYEETDWNVNAEGGDMCLQLVGDTHCTNSMGIRLDMLDPGEVQRESEE